MVESAYDRRWKENADELRLEAGKLANIESRIEMQNQMRFRKQREEQQREEDMLYHELWKRDHDARLAREEAEKRKQYEMNQTRLNELNK
jgi:hypothetical protein